MILIAGNFGIIDWYTSLRDLITYAITLISTALLMSNGYIDTYNAILMLMVFFVYWMFMKYNKTIEKTMRKAVYLKSKFRIGPRLEDAEIAEAQTQKRRGFEYIPDYYTEVPYKLEGGFIECTYQGVTGIFFIHEKRSQTKLNR